MAGAPLAWTSVTCWRWVAEEALAGDADLAARWRPAMAQRVADLPSFRASGEKPRRRVAFLRLEEGGLPSPAGDAARSADPPKAADAADAREVRQARVAWFSGTIFDRVGDKDQLAAAVERHPELKALLPASCLLSWDVDTEQGVRFPAQENCDPAARFVFKPPLGCQGNGIEFVTTADRQRILDVITRDAAAARTEPNFLQHLENEKGRIPSWVIQSYIPSMLIRDGRKFHVRAYVLAREGLLKPAEFFVFDQFECRIACNVYQTDNYGDRGAHITNGAGGSDTDRRMLHEVPELDAQVVRDFVAALLGGTFGAELAKVPEVDQRQAAQATCLFSLCALDIMIDRSGRPWLLECNAKCPACPPKGLGSPAFQAHLVRFMQSLIKFALLDIPGPFSPLDQIL